MNSIQKIKDSPHYLWLKESVEYRHCRKQCIVITAVVGLLALPFLITAIVLLGRGGNSSAMYGIMWFVFLGIGYLFVVAYSAYSWLEIFMHIDSYMFCEVLLDQPHMESYVRGGSRIRFTLSFTDCHGKQIQRDTSAIFSSDCEPYLEDYNNQKVIIGYNEETDRVVVIQRLDDKSIDNGKWKIDN